MAAPAPALEIFHPLFPPGEKPSLKGYERLVHTKQTEIDLVMTENAQLRLAMDRLERELTTLAEALQERTGRCGRCRSVLMIAIMKYDN